MPVLFRPLVILLMLAAAPAAQAQLAHAAGDAPPVPVWASDDEPVMARTFDLTLERAVELAMGGSYQVRQLQLGIERSRSWLKAEQAGLKSRFYMNLSTPEIEAVTDNKWNSNIRQYELVRENTRRWQMNFAVEQPVVLFGYPTNGYLSFNNRVYRYAQFGDDTDVRYYNRYFVKYQQPFFQPNRLKNDIEEAELDLADEELEFREDIVELIERVADDYYDLLEIAYRRTIYEEQLAFLARAEEAAQALARKDSSRALDVTQVEVELANVREALKQTGSDFRIEASRAKQRLGLTDEDVLRVDPALVLRPIQVDEERAIRYARTLRPYLRKLDIRRRQNQINISNARGWDSFRANLEVTYGREMQDPRFQELWDRPTNSYSVGFHAYIPIWDWGRRSYRIQAQKISLEKTELYIEEADKQIRTNIANAIRNLEEYEERAMTMEENLERSRQIAQYSLERYRAGAIGIFELLQGLGRQQETAQNFLGAYLGYKRALFSLQQQTYYDFERDMPLFQRFGIDGAARVASR